MGINHCQETRLNTCTCQHWAICLANDYLPSWLGTTQISVILATFYPYFGRQLNGNRSKSKDKILQIYRFVLYPAMMVASHQLDRLANAGKCMFHLVSLLLQQCLIPTPLYKSKILKLFLYIYFLWFSYSYSQLASF